MCISSEKNHERNIVMKIRTARLEEIPEIMKIYDTATRFMQEHENPTQW